MNALNVNILDAADASITQTSSIVDCFGLLYTSQVITIEGTSDLTSTLQVFVSNDPPPPGASLATGWTPTNWLDFTGIAYGGGGGPTPNQDGNYFLMTVLPVRWVKVVYTPSAGTGGTITINFFGQG